MYQYGSEALRYPKKESQQRNNPSRKVNPHKKKEKAVSGISALEKLIYIGVIVAVVAVLSMLLARNATINQLNYAIQAVEQESALLTEQNELLQVEVTSLSSADRIIQIATEELGMTMKDSSVRVLSNKQESNEASE